MECRVIKALRLTWQAIGGDILNTYRDPASAELTAEEVREHVSTCGFVGGFPESHGGDREAVEWLESLSFGRQDALLAEAPRGRRSATRSPRW
jgi:hypothetical protein